MALVHWCINPFSGEEDRESGGMSMSHSFNNIRFDVYLFDRDGRCAPHYRSDAPIPR